jgi:CheY-like chemotaxis protein
MASILVIDDDEQVRAALRRILEEAEYMVVVASNGLLCST